MENGVMMQYFEWNMPQRWGFVESVETGCLSFTCDRNYGCLDSPAYKALKQDDEGYGTYDLYDLGEFDQKKKPSGQNTVPNSNYRK